MGMRSHAFPLYFTPGRLTTREEWSTQHWEPRIHDAHQQAAVRHMKGPNTWGKQYLWPFQASGAYFRPQAPKARKVSGSRLNLPGVYTPRRVDSQTLVLRFPDFLLAPTQNSKDLELRSYSRKSHWGTQRPVALYLFCASPSGSLRDSSRSCRTNYRPTAPAGVGGFSTRKVYSRWSHLADRTSKIAFQLRRRPQLCLSIAQQPTTRYGIAASPAKLLRLLPDRHMVCMIMEMVGNSNFTLTIGNGKRNRLRGLKNGLPQESVLAPLLFNIYNSYLPTTVSRKYAYADDLAIMYANGFRCRLRV